MTLLTAALVAAGVFSFGLGLSNLADGNNNIAYINFLVAGIDIGLAFL